jgi:hypothetical protein
MSDAHLSERYNELCNHAEFHVSLALSAILPCVCADYTSYGNFLLATRCTRHDADCLVVLAAPWNDHRVVGAGSRHHQRFDHFLGLQLFFYPTVLHTHRPPAYGRGHFGCVSDRSHCDQSTGGTRPGRSRSSNSPRTGSHSTL